MPSGLYFKASSAGVCAGTTVRRQPRWANMRRILILIPKSLDNYMVWQRSSILLLVALTWLPLAVSPLINFFSGYYLGKILSPSWMGTQAHSFISTDAWISGKATVLSTLFTQDTGKHTGIDACDTRLLILSQEIA